jgi:sugar lactone lactonase YvrE
MTWQTLSTTPCELGESPFWHPHEQMLYWVDIPGKKIQRANVYLGSVESWDLPTEPGRPRRVPDQRAPEPQRR